MSVEAEVYVCGCCGVCTLDEEKLGRERRRRRRKKNFSFLALLTGLINQQALVLSCGSLSLSLSLCHPHAKMLLFLSSLHLSIQWRLVLLFSKLSRRPSISRWTFSWIEHTRLSSLSEKEKNKTETCISSSSSSSFCPRS